jgi:hypothetical protein
MCPRCSSIPILNVVTEADWFGGCPSRYDMYLEFVAIFRCNELFDPIVLSLVRGYVL